MNKKPACKDDMQNQDEAFSASIIASLEQDSLDYATQIKLKQARQAALEQGQSGFAGSAFGDVLVLSLRRWWPLLLIPLIAAFWLALAQQSAPGDSELFEDIEILTTEAEPDMLSELEFYQWLADEGDVGE